MLKIAVVDDEIVFVESLINKITAVCENLILNLKLTNTQADLIYLKITASIIWFSWYWNAVNWRYCYSQADQRIERFSWNTFIVYVTSHDELVFDALKSFPYSFIRKSKIESDLYECINRINNSFEELHKTIVLHTERKDIPIVIGDIIYLEKLKIMLCIILKSRI